MFFTAEDLSRDMAPHRIDEIIAKSLTSLEKRALQVQCNASAERRQRHLLQEISSFEKRALELQCTTSASEAKRKLLQSISEVEEKALALQYVAGASPDNNPKRHLLDQVSSVDKRALELQCATSATEAARKRLQGTSEVEEKALALQHVASAREAARKRLQGMSEAEEKALAQQYSPREEDPKQNKFRSSWTAPTNKVGQYAKEGADYLYELGASSDINLNIDVGQTSQFIDKKFTMGDGGLTADIADGSLRKFEFRKFENIKGDYWIPKVNTTNAGTRFPSPNPLTTPPCTRFA